MKRFTFSSVFLPLCALGLSLALCLGGCSRERQVFPKTGVWVSDDAELLLTDSVMLYFEKQPGGSILAMVRLGSVAEDCGVFSPDTVVRGKIPAGFHIGEPDAEGITVNGKRLVKAEDVETCPPYDMQPATDPASVGDRLTEWRLGVTGGFDPETGDIVVEANTRGNMFIYHILHGMYYVRAAKAANTDKGTLFHQNIRVMKNPNTGENSLYFAEGNRDFVLHELEVDPTAFDPNACHFSPDGGIYWSYISHTPDRILLNGCGETYQVDRQLKKNDNLYEWIR